MKVLVDTNDLITMLNHIVLSNPDQETVFAFARIGMAAQRTPRPCTKKVADPNAKIKARVREVGQMAGVFVNKIAAIKELRAMFFYGLKESKDIIDAGGVFTTTNAAFEAAKARQVGSPALILELA
jgi:ribosomal protein L7/L12